MKASASITIDAKLFITEASDAESKTVIYFDNVKVAFGVFHNCRELWSN